MFEEDVDMEVENERRASTNAGSIPPSTPAERETAQTNVIDGPISVHPADNQIDKPIIQTDIEMSNKSKEVNEESSSSQMKESSEVKTIDKESNAIAEPISTDNTTPNHTESVGTKSGKDETGRESEEANPATDENPETPKVESVAAVMHPTADVGSRFYIKRRIIVGNVSKFLNPGKKENVNERTANI